MSAMTSNFGGKKAAPFRKGGKPRKAIVAKAVVAKAKRAKREMALSVITGREIDLAGKWKHGWIPLDATAAAIKAHKGKGAHVAAPSMDEHAKIIGRHVEAARKEAAASSTGDYTRETPTHVGPKGQGFVRVTHSPKGSKYTTSTEVGGQRVHTTHNNGSVAALELHNRLYGVHKSMGSTSGDRLPKPQPDTHQVTYTHPDGRKGSTLFTSDKKGHDLHAAATEHVRKNVHPSVSVSHVESTSSGKPKPNVTVGGKPAYLKPDHSSDVDPAKVEARKAELIKNAEKMYGTGSKQHFAALQRFGTESQKRAAAHQIRKGNPATRITGTGGKKATELTYPEHKDVQAAHTFLGSLKPGDNVMFHDGTKEHKVTVQRALHRGDGGGFGSNDHSRVTVGYGPGRWNTEVTPANLVGLHGVKKKIRKVV